MWRRASSAEFYDHSDIYPYFHRSRSVHMYQASVEPSLVGSRVRSTVVRTADHGRVSSIGIPAFDAGAS